MSSYSDRTEEIQRKISKLRKELEILESDPNEPFYKQEKIRSRIGELEAELRDEIIEGIFT